MAKYLKKLSKMAGQAPGTLVHIGDKKTDKVRITIFDYNAEHYTEREAGNVEECFPFKRTPTVTWINIDGLHDISTLEKIGSEFELHPLVLEDIANTAKRPAIEIFDSYIFLLFKMIYYDNETDKLSMEQVSLVLGKNFVLSFQEQAGDVFGPIRDRIRKGKGKLRKMGPDYLAYALLDAVVDNYFIVLEKFGDDIEKVEDELSETPGQDTLKWIHECKRNTIVLRRAVWPLRDVINSLVRGESALVKKTTEIYLRDVYDHAIQVMDTVESFRDIISGLVDLYLSSISNRMNEVMKTLTIFASIFIPLTFIAGVYGMNFEYMPELGWRWGYYAALGIMAVVAVGLLFFFKRKKWF